MQSRGSGYSSERHRKSRDARTQSERKGTEHTTGHRAAVGAGHMTQKARRVGVSKRGGGPMGVGSGLQRRWGALVCPMGARSATGGVAVRDGCPEIRAEGGRGEVHVFLDHAGWRCCSCC